MRRLLAVVVAATALWIAAPTSVMAQASCAAVQDLAGLRQAGADLAAAPPDVPAAAAVVRQLIASYPSASRTLRPVLNDLTTSPPDVADAQTVVAGIIGVLALPPGATCNADQRPARAALDQVYASPVFAKLDQKSGPSLLGQILAWIGSLFQRVGSFLGPGGAIVGGSIALLLAIALAWWRLRGVLGSRAARAEAEPPGDSDDPKREWSMADRAAARGDYREAIRRAFRSALLEVAARGRLPVDPTWTTHELLTATRADASLLATLAPASQGFDTAWYSGRAVTASDWELSRARCEAVRAVARSRSTAAP